MVCRLIKQVLRLLRMLLNGGRLWTGPSCNLKKKRTGETGRMSEGAGMGVFDTNKKLDFDVPFYSVARGERGGKQGQVYMCIKDPRMPCEGCILKADCRIYREE
jgi:hypothetical protein